MIVEGRLELKGTLTVPPQQNWPFHVATTNSRGSSGCVGGTGQQLQLGAGSPLSREAEGAFLTDHAAISKETTGVSTLLYSSEPDLYLVNKGQETKQTYKDKDVSVNIWVLGTQQRVG